MTIDWSVSEAAGASNLRLRWEECGGPAVDPPESKGFGSRLLEHGLALDLGGTVQLSFARSGVVAAVVAPLAAMTA